MNHPPSMRLLEWSIAAIVIFVIIALAYVAGALVPLP